MKNRTLVARIKVLKEKIEKIQEQFKGVDIAELTTLEKNILKILNG